LTATPVRKAREALGARLAEIRKDAGQTGRALAAACGWHPSKVSKIEHGTQAPSDADIRAWCTACRADGQLADLIASTRAIESMYVEWRLRLRPGLARSVARSVPLYRRTQLFRVYESHVIPGLLQTPAYAAAMFRYWVDFMNLPDDVDQAVATRQARQRVLHTAGRRFVFVLEEQALRTHVGDPAVMVEQLGYLVDVMSLPSVSIGVIPAMATRHTLAQGSFWMFDRAIVRSEGITAGLEITQPREIDLFARTFELLRASAVHGTVARLLIESVATSFDAMSSNVVEPS
jgi:transcriptional regulator with XRE-family HTH domain